MMLNGSKRTITVIMLSNLPLPIAIQKFFHTFEAEKI